MTHTCISLFSGGGLADAGLIAAGFLPIGAVEYCARIAEVYATNFGDHVRCESVMDTDFGTFDRPDLLWASPECKEFSQAKSGGSEGPVQRAQAEAICRALTTLTPATFVLENVIGYGRSKSLARILDTLVGLGYWPEVSHVNAADFGVPQTRRRLIVRAVRGGLVPHLPPPVAWVGWYAAIEDLLPTLPESRFAPWQLARLPEWLGDSVLVHPTETRSDGTVGAIAPAFTVTGTHGVPRAFLIGGGNTQLAQVDSKHRDAAAPAFTVAGNESATTNQRAFLMRSTNTGQEWGKGYHDEADPALTITAQMGGMPPRAWLDQGRVVAMNARALARFQSCPDSYILPDNRALACQIIGNGVPSLLAQRIGESLRGAA